MLMLRNLHGFLEIGIVWDLGKICFLMCEIMTEMMIL